jgi:WD40 repeat protein
MQVLSGHRKVVHSVAFSPDRTLLASGSGDRTVKLWDLSSGAAVATWEKFGVMGVKVAFSPDGRWLAAINWDHVWVYDVAARERVHMLGGNPAGWVQTIAFTPDGRRLLATGQRGYWDAWHAWDTRTWTESATPKLPVGRPPVVAAAVSPDGGLLAGIGFHELLVWDLKKGKLLQAVDVQGSSTVPNMTVAFSPDGATLLYGHTTALQAAEPATLRPLGRLQLKAKHFQGAAFAPDGGAIFTVSNEETVKTWLTTTWAAGPEFAWQAGKLKCVAVGPDGLRAACGGDKGKIVVWDVDG